MLGKVVQLLSVAQGTRNFSRKLGNVKQTPTFLKDKQLVESTKEMREAPTLYTMLADDKTYNRVMTDRKALLTE